jgi:iron complex transport system ATP-binding protein
MLSPVTSVIACHELTIRVPGRTLVENLDLAVASGDFVAVLGQNGAGKTRTMHTLAGLLAADGGYVELGGQALEVLKRPEVARRVALLPQYVDDVFPATVMETVLIGRHPHIGLLELESSTDREIASRSLQLVDLAGFAERDIATLSGGERRRVAIAQVLTQSPGIYLLDEPTNHLDPQHQLDVLEVFASQAQQGAAVIANLHDVNLAVRFATRCLLLYGDGRWSSGETSQVLDEQRLTELYGTRMEAVRWRQRNIFMAH